MRSTARFHLNRINALAFACLLGVAQSAPAAGLSRPEVEAFDQLARQSLQKASNAPAVRDVLRLWAHSGDTSVRALDLRSKVLREWTTPATAPTENEASRFGVYAMKSAVCLERSCRPGWDALQVLPQPGTSLSVDLVLNAGFGNKFCHALFAGHWVSQTEATLQATGTSGGPYQARLTLTATSARLFFERSAQLSRLSPETCSEGATLPEEMRLPKMPAAQVYPLR